MVERKLYGEVVDIKTLEDKAIGEMYTLMDTFYDNVGRSNFEEDLMEKRDVILLNDSEGNIRGFSTLMLLEEEVSGRPVNALFSGDTIIHRDYWGEQELPSLWGGYVAKLVGEMPPEGELYWFLMSKGYKTYRFLPAFFNDFHPRYDRDFPEDQKEILDTFALSRFPDNYDPSTGLISFGGDKDHLKEGVAEIGECELRKPHIKYFVEKNPGWAKGDELACIASLSMDNFNRRAIDLILRKTG
ncbi:MAG: hypothetical protein IH845_05225 [Nanoarchaeota archaeon]|nr:hypothetical protein [Nanoarchaeota archaeon]